MTLAGTLSRRLRAWVGPLLASLAAACGDGEKSAVGVGGASNQPEDSSPPGSVFEFDTVSSETTRVSLAALAKRAVDRDSLDWDLAFSGLDIFTNSGPSGPGKAAVFGPIPDFEMAISASTGVPPSTPFLRSDESGGAFLNWYLYEGATHALWSRQHIYGIRQATRFWKLQVLSYYGEVQGAPISALYRLRFSEVIEGQARETRELNNLNGTAGGLNATEDAASGCLDLSSGVTSQLTKAAAKASTEWHLCFRRERISVNGGSGGPADVEAIDLDADKLASENVDAVRARDAQAEAQRFEQVDYGTLATAQGYRGDGIVSMFSGTWLEPNQIPAAPRRSVAWRVVGADGVSEYVIAFERLDGATAEGIGHVVMRVLDFKTLNQ